MNRKILGSICFGLAMFGHSLAVFASGELFSIDLWPGEGIPILTAKIDNFAVRLSPNAKAPVIGALKNMKGRRIDFQASVFKTVQEGSIECLKDSKLEGRAFGDVSHLSKSDYYRTDLKISEVSCKKGQTIRLLQKRAEGTCFG